jgi:hypothetical protein
LTEDNPLTPVLKIAMSMAKSQLDMFKKMTEAARIPEVKALLAVLAESESSIVDKIAHMMVSGVVDEIEELSAAKDEDALPDATPFDPAREDSDPRTYVCNKTLREGIRAYTLYLRMATRAESELVSRVFEYLAHLQMFQITQIRRICGSY